jgi:PadR family transcriptional regulator AphA
MSRPQALSTTSYAVLSLLSVQPWSTYELTRQMDRSLGRVWPRARSKLYEEPKKLVRLGLAEAEAERVGRRSRTLYRITDEGRRALTGWHRSPSQGPVLEFEHLVKMMFAENGTRSDALAQLADVRAWARERNEANLEAARDYAAGSGPFQDRAARTMLAGAFLTDFYALVDRWAEWATGVVQGWPEDPGDAVADPEALRAILRRAEWSEAGMMPP